LIPGRDVSDQGVVDDGEPSEDKIVRLIAELESQFAESAKFESTIRVNLAGLGCSHSKEDPISSIATTTRRAKSHREDTWGVGRQDRVEPADERDAGGDGEGAVSELVRRFRPRQKEL